MKMEYIAPQIEEVKPMQTESLLITLSGGEVGNDGDTAQSKEIFELFDDEED